MIFDRLRKKKDDVSLPPPLEVPSAELPEDLERFRMRTPEIKTEVGVPEIKNNYNEAAYGKTVEDLVAERTSGDKIELILQKLETIDARLRLIEEKIKRY